MIFTPPPWTSKLAEAIENDLLLGDFILQGRRQEAAHITKNQATLIDSDTRDTMDRPRLEADVAALAVGLQSELQRDQKLDGTGYNVVAILSENSVRTDRKALFA